MAVKPAKGPPRGGLAEISQREDFPEIMREMHSKERGGKGDRIRRGVSHDKWCELYDKLDWGNYSQDGNECSQKENKDE